MPRRSLKESQRLRAAELEPLYASEPSNEKIDAYMLARCKIIGRNVRLERKKRKITIDTLSESLELSASYVGLLERGDRCPSLKSVFRLCEVFDVKPNELLLGKGPDVIISENDANIR